MAGNIDKVLENIRKRKSQVTKEKEKSEEVKKVIMQEEDDDDFEDDADNEESEEVEEEPIIKEDKPIKKPVQESVNKAHKQATEEEIQLQRQRAMEIEILQNDGIYRAELLQRLDILITLIDSLLGDKK